jgi:hypothetical protein
MEYSLTDCVSLLAMGLTEIFTDDHHFTQEGFRVNMACQKTSPALPWPIPALESNP